MNRYHIYLDYNYNGPEILVEEDTKGGWVSFNDADERIKELEYRLGLDHMEELGERR